MDFENTQNPDVNIAEVEKKFAKKTRELDGFWKNLVSIICIIGGLYHLYSAYTLVFPTMWHRSIHLSMGLFLTFVLYPRGKTASSKVPIYDVVLAVASISFTIYLITNYMGIISRAGIPNSWDVFFGVIVTILVLEATRRVMGWPLVIIAIIAVLYAFAGPYMPGLLMHRGYGISRIAEEMFLTTNGIFGVPIYVSSTFVIIFIFFGAFLQQSGGAKFFIDLAYALTGRSRGGPAKAAVVASGFLGMISGSAYANVVGTGQFTIPLMKKVGYSPEFAGGVEAASSTGGQIAPPIMGAAAFIMAEMIGIGYGKLIIYAAIPAFLYFSAIFIMVDIRAAKRGLKGFPADQLPKIWSVLKKDGLLLIPPIVIVGLLLYGFSPIRASLYSVLSIILVSSVKASTRMGPVELAKALEAGVKTSLNVIAACGVTGVVIGVVTLTGLGLKLANIIIALSGGYLWATLMITMIVCIIMGMGLPTTALYVILASLVAPAMVQMGVNIISAHLFIFYFGVFAAVTPPVCLTSYLAAAIADGHPTRTAFEGFRLSMAAFIVPFLFTFSPELLLIDTNFWQVLTILISSLIGIYALGASLEGYMVSKISILERIICFACAISLLDPGLITDMLSIPVLGVLYFFRKYLLKKMEEKNRLSS